MAVNVSYQVSFGNMSHGSTMASALDAAVTEGSMFAQLVADGLTNLTSVMQVVASSITLPSPLPPPLPPLAVTNLPGMLPKPPRPLPPPFPSPPRIYGGVVAVQILVSVASWSTKEEATLKASMAESLGVDEGRVQIADVDFEVRGSYRISGMTAQEWSAATAATFAHTMQQELGYHVNVTRVDIATADNYSGRHRRHLRQTGSGALHVLFTVQGLKDSGSAVSAKVNVVQIAEQPQGVMEPRLLGKLAATGGRSIEVSVCFIFNVQYVERTFLLK